MDYETKKGGLRALETLVNVHLENAWPISFQLTENICRGAPLLIKAWKTSMETSHRYANRSPKGLQRNSP